MNTQSVPYEKLSDMDRTCSFCWFDFAQKELRVLTNIGLKSASYMLQDFYAPMTLWRLRPNGLPVLLRKPHSGLPGFYQSRYIGGAN